MLCCCNVLYGLSYDLTKTIGAASSSGEYVLRMVRVEESTRFKSTVYRFIESKEGGAYQPEYVCELDSGDHFGFDAIHISNDGVYIAFIGQNDFQAVRLYKKGVLLKAWKLDDVYPADLKARLTKKPTVFGFDRIKWYENIIMHKDSIFFRCPDGFPEDAPLGFTIDYKNLSVVKEKTRKQLMEELKRKEKGE